jgi:hypothetical protein
MSLTKVSYSMIAGAPANIMDFGAVGDGVTDDTAAVQAAFDYAITNNIELVASNTFLLAGKVTINKPSGDRTPFYVSGGGAFKKMNAGAMFDAANNATSEIFFNNVKFVGNPAVNVVGFECNQEFIRGYFYNCSFESLDVCFDSTGYLMQSFRIDGCDFSGIKSWVVDCGTTGGFPTGSAYDVHITHCQIEGQSGGVLRGSPGGVSVGQCVIENISGQPAFYITNSGSINISNNYFEDCQQGVVVCAPLSNCAGIVAINNYVNLAVSTDFIVWGKVLSGCVTIGNVVNGGATNETTQTTNGNVVVLNDHNIGFIPDGSASKKVGVVYPGTFTPVVEGTVSAGTATYTRQDGHYTLIGNVVNFTMTVEWSGHTGTGNIIVAGLPLAPKNEYFALSALPGQLNGLTLPNGKLLTAGVIDGLPHAYVLTLSTDGSVGTYGFLSLASYTSGFVTISGSYLI